MMDWQRTTKQDKISLKLRFLLSELSFKNFGMKTLSFKIKARHKRVLTKLN